MAATIALAGCGDDEGPQIPEGQSIELRNRLQDVKRQVEAGDACNVRDSTLTSLEAQVSALPDDLDEDVRQTVEDGAERLRELVDEECADTPEEEPEETETEETPTETAPPETEPPETEPLPPPEADDEDDGGDGDGDEEELPGGEEPGSGGIGPGAQRRGRR